jgi:hypothetical protein
MSLDILKTPGLEKATHGIEAEPKPRFFSLRAGDFTVHIESTAHKVMDGITRFSIEHQKLIIRALLDHLDEPGKSLLLKEDKLSGPETAYVTRRHDGPLGKIHLLFSR